MGCSFPFRLRARRKQNGAQPDRTGLCSDVAISEAVPRPGRVENSNAGRTEFYDAVSVPSDDDRFSDLRSFHSSEPFKSFSNVQYSYDSSPSTAVSENNSHVGQRASLSTHSTAGMSPTYRGPSRIPSTCDVTVHPEDYWWSEANLLAGPIGADLGSEPSILCRVVMATVLPSEFFASHRDMDAFPNYKENKKLIIFKIKMGNIFLVSLHEVINESLFNSIFSDANRDELLLNKLKFIIRPINVPIPIPAKRPKNAETVGSYFGMDSVDLYGSANEGAVSIVINIYSKWVIRKFLPMVTSSVGRICDFVLLDSHDRVVFANFRLLSTKLSKTLLSAN